MVTAMKGAGTLRALSLLVLFSLLLGCAPKVHISTIGSFERIDTLCLKRAGKSENPLMDRFVESVLADTLKGHGVKVSPECGDLVLEYDYGVTPRQMYVPRIIYGGSDVMTFLAYRLEEGRAVPEIYTVIPPPATYYYTDVETVYVHWIVLRLKRKGEPIWIGEASVEEYTPDIRARIGTLAGKLLTFFGKDTGRMIEVKAE